MPIDHAGAYVQLDAYQKNLDLYVEALKPLGYEIGLQFGPTVTGLAPAEAGIPGYKPCDFWIIGVQDVPNAPVHVAFRAKGKRVLEPNMKYTGLLLMVVILDRASVDAFHAAAIKAGAEDNGAPGIRSHYHANYYAAFFKDQSGNNIEAVFHGSE